MLQTPASYPPSDAPPCPCGGEALAANGMFRVKADAVSTRQLSPDSAIRAVWEDSGSLGGPGLDPHEPDGRGNRGRQADIDHPASPIVGNEAAQSIAGDGPQRR